jgi:hypothetical protein
LSRNPAVNEISIGSRSIAKITLQDISRAREGIDCFLSSKFFSYVDSTGLSLKFLDLKRKGLRLRMISDISLKQASLYRGFLNYFEIRHFDKIAYNILLIDDSEFVMFLNENNDKRRLLRMSDKTFVSAQQFLFNSLWSIALPYKEKIKEFEYDKEKSFTKDVSKSYEIRNIIRKSITSSIDEILVLFSELEVLIHSKKLGILDLLEEASKNGVRVRTIVYCENKKVKDELRDSFHDNFPNISVQYLQKPLQTKMTTMIFDRMTFLDISPDFNFGGSPEAGKGLSVYSNNEIKLNSLLSIFEFLWIQSDIDNQKVIKEAYFKLFKGFNLRDENYKRSWKFEKSDKRS